MLQASNKIKVALKASIESALGVKVYSMQQPTEDNRYVLLSDVAETALDEKRSFISQGVMAINVIEKFLGRGGSPTWVDSASVLISQTLTPTRLSSFGNLNGITIFSMRISDTSEDTSRENATGRTAIKTLRFEYKFQTT